MSGGATSRRKGARWQADLARRWRESGLYPDAHSTQGAQVRSRRSLGKTPPDVDGTPWWVEAGHGRMTPVAKLRQAVREAQDAGDDRTPIAVIKPQGDRVVGPVVVMRLEDWERMILAQREGWES